MIPNTKPMKFTPKGVVDAFDATEEFQGACQLLQNCIFDQSNPELVIPRPGVVTLADLATGAGSAGPGSAGQRRVHLVSKSTHRAPRSAVGRSGQPIGR